MHLLHYWSEYTFPTFYNNILIIIGAFWFSVIVFSCIYSAIILFSLFLCCKLITEQALNRVIKIIKTILYFLDLPTNRDLKLIVFAFFSQLPSTREVGNQAAWSLSSCKPGFGVEQIRDDNYETYWQSDGQLPHLVNIQFKRKTTVSAVAIYTDFRWAPYFIIIQIV